VQIRVPLPPPSAEVAPQQASPTAPQGAPVTGDRHDPFVQMPSAPVPVHSKPAETQMRWAPPPASVVTRRQQPPALQVFPAQHASPDSPQADTAASDVVMTPPSAVSPPESAAPSEPPAAGASTTTCPSTTAAPSPVPPLELSGAEASSVATTPPLPMATSEPAEPPDPPGLPPPPTAGPSCAPPLPPPQAAATSKKDKRAIGTAFAFRRFVYTGSTRVFAARVFMGCPPRRQIASLVEVAQTSSPKVPNRDL
jgi:hypothetical protein